MQPHLGQQRRAFTLAKISSDLIRNRWNPIKHKPPTDAMAAMLTAEEICAYDNAKLCRYLEENGHVVRVSDPQNLPKSFIDRLK